VFAGLSLVLLRRGRGARGRLAALAVYTFSCVFLLSMSGVYHSLTPGGAPRAVLARLDHAAIFVLIAGTYTPIIGALFVGRERWLPLVLIWLAAIAGVAIKLFYFAGLPEWVGLIFYLGLGWAGIAPGFRLWLRYGERFVRPLLWGGIAYSVGAVLEFLRRPTLVPGVIGSHEVFHLLVLVGISCHWYFVVRVAVGGPLPAARVPGGPGQPDSQCMCPTSFVRAGS
jgi:channel protein (hemolysin III family)